MLLHRLIALSLSFALVSSVSGHHSELNVVHSPHDVASSASSVFVKSAHESIADGDVLMASFDPEKQLAYIVENRLGVPVVDSFTRYSWIDKLVPVEEKYVSNDATTYFVMVVPIEYETMVEEILIDFDYEMLQEVEASDYVPRESLRKLIGAVDTEGVKLNKEAIVAAMTEPEYATILQQLSGARPLPIGTTLQTRQSVSSQFRTASEFALDFLQTEAGCDEAFFQEFSMSGSTSRNVICVKLGTSSADEIVVVGAHLDSTSERASTLAPGAVDNASGSVGVMLLAKALRPYRFGRTIHFILFGGEEQGLIGSTYYVNQRASNGYNVVAGYTQDMTAYSNRYFGVTIEGTRDSAIQSLMQVYYQNMQQLAPSLSSAFSNNSFGSDHVPFQRAGIPCILLIEQDDTAYPSYHRTTDTFDKCNTRQGVSIAHGLAGALCDTAGLLA